VDAVYLPGAAGLISTRPTAWSGIAT
jgi:hypothetical protein